MTKEEAMQILSTRDAHGVMCGYTGGYTEAIEIAIESLQRDIERHKMVIRASERYLGVVRCKDCKYADFESPYPVCSLIEMNITDDDFCSWGEREEE